VLLAIAVAVRWSMGRPVLFRQVRPGRAGEPFALLKFRTMTDRCDADGRPLPDADRLTGLGRLLRRTSLDELPELWNVVRGDMSLVGPRPLLVEYLPLYSPEQARRHEVRPGITGWAQVNGRNATTWEARFAHDVYYVDHRSFGLDLRILLRTVAQVLTGAGVSAPGEATMARFTGSPADRADVSGPT
jgi:lipopolysaccharide/colanic/teichoic acid biosynthesis glycosyltransferase